MTKSYKIYYSDNRNEFDIVDKNNLDFLPELLKGHITKIVPMPDKMEQIPMDPKSGPVTWVSSVIPGSGIISSPPTISNNK